MTAKELPCFAQRMTVMKPITKPSLGLINTCKYFLKYEFIKIVSKVLNGIFRYKVLI